MKKPLKIALRTLGIVAGVLLLALVAVRLFLPVERIRDLAVAEATERLGREVVVGEVGVSLRGGLGVSVRDVVIGNPEGFAGAPFLDAAACDLKLRLGPLLSRRMEIDRLVVEQPRLRLVRRADGEDNFTFARLSAADGEGGAGTGSGASASVSFDRFAIAGGELEFRDEGGGVAVRLSGVDLAASLANPGAGRYVLESEGEFDTLLVQTAETLPPLFGGAAFALEHDAAAGLTTLTRGDVQLNHVAGELTGSFAATDELTHARGHLVVADAGLGALFAFLPRERLAALDGIDLAGRLRADVDFSWEPDRETPLDFSGRAELTGGEISGPRMPQPVEELAATVDFTRLDARIVKGTARTAAGSIEASGSVSGLPTVPEAPAPHLDLELAADLDLAPLANLLPPTAGAELGGRVRGTAQLRGAADAPADLFHAAEARIAGLSYADVRMPVPLERLDADLVWRNGVLEITELAADFPGTDVAGRATVRDLLPWALPPAHRGAGYPALPSAEFDLVSRRCDVDRLIPVASPGAAPAAGAEPGTGGETRSMPDFLGVGAVRVDTLVYGRVEFTDVTGQVEIRDRTIACRDLAGDVYTGTVTGTATVDLSDLDEPVYAGSYRAEHIEADDFLSRFTRFAGVVFGKFDLEGTYAATGRDADRLRSSITMDSLARMREGRVVTSGVVHRGLDELAGRFGGHLEPEQALRELATAIRVQDGRLILDDLRTSLGELGDLELGGAYGFDGELDYTGSLLLSDRHSRELLGGGLAGEVGRLLGGDDPERVTLPLRVDGTFAQPRFGLDYSVLGRRAAEGLADEAKEKLKGLFD